MNHMIQSIFQSLLKMDNLDPIMWPPSSPIVEAIFPSFIAFFADQGSFVNSISGYVATYSLQIVPKCVIGKQHLKKNSWETVTL